MDRGATTVSRPPASSVPATPTVTFSVDPGERWLRTACRPFRVHRTCLAAALLLVLSGPGLANPVGPEVVQGASGFATAGPVLTVTPSASAVIQWRSFNVAPGETVRFVQPGGSTVLNRVPEGMISLGGGIESNARVLFLSGSSLSGAGVQIDLAGSVDSSLRLQPGQATRRAVARQDSQERAVMLTGDRVFVIGADSVMRGPAGRMLLAPGRSAELGHLSLPNVRVHVSAPAATPVDLDSLVTRRAVSGIFNALFAPRPGPRGEEGGAAGGTAVARAEPAPMEERIVTVFAAPVEDRVPYLLPVIPAPIEERIVVAFAAPVEDRAPYLLPVVPAPIEERVVAAAPVEERVAGLLPVVVAPVEERQVLVAWIAPVEERAGNAVARSAPVNIPLSVESLKIAAADFGSAAGTAVGTTYPAAAEARATSHETSVVDGLMRVSASAMPIVTVPAAASPVSAPAQIAQAQVPVRLPAIKRRMPRIMVDHKGGIFHL